MDRARCLLDELLGPNRDRLVKEEWDDVKDRNSCVFMLSSFCPYELFHNTGLNLGRCPFRNHEKYLCKLYEQCGLPRAKEKEKELSGMLTEIYFDNCKRIIRRWDFIEKQVRGDKDYVFKWAFLKAKLDERYKELDINVSKGSFEKATACFIETSSLELDINRHVAQYLKVCKYCGKEFSTDAQPPRYWDLHIRSKLHLSFALTRSKLVEILRKSGQKDEIVSYEILKAIQKKAWK